MDYSRAKDPDLTRTKYAAGLADIAIQARKLPPNAAISRSPWPRRSSRWDAAFLRPNASPGPRRSMPHEAKPCRRARRRSTPNRPNGFTRIRRPNSSSRPFASATSRITALPNEVYGITGLKLKAQSPLPATFNIELANGAEGYIPPARTTRPWRLHDLARPHCRTRRNGRAEDRRERFWPCSKRSAVNLAELSPTAKVPTVAPS